ncbi:MAG: 16S rRNA (cytosine(1402)-N(4))-methyltransferase RsmH [Xanthomonadales bacterium]|jgi:16S rRNA (cytosine1402-N4)-methyltransferase|nr:16S rRNA (cytosine(1402)-N(4))-methyltransferase RsmH [Xanthomonadales bacterium]
MESGGSAQHVPVMKAEVLEGLQPSACPSGHYVDGTFGRGGHSRALLTALGPAARLSVCDRDPQALDTARQLAASDSRLVVVAGNYADLLAGLTPASVEGVLLDLGVSSPQLDQPERGFSFQHDGPLDMRFGDGESAADWLARVDERTLADTLYHYGEERRSRAVARAIVAARSVAPLTRTAQLAELIARVVPREPGKHPATRSFQAIRIAVNDELGALERGLAAAHVALKPGGRLAVISFHSLEDRIVKQFIHAHSRPPVATRRGPPLAQPAFVPTLRVSRGALKPSAAEQRANPRARSAVLRIAERA